MVMAPYKNKEQEIVGAIGVVGPTRLNYSKIVPLVDYTSKIIGKVLKIMTIKKKTINKKLKRKLKKRT